MNTTHVASMGDRGRLVIPAQLRSSQRWSQGTTLVLIETEHAVVVTTRDQARAIVSEQLQGTDLVAELLAERRAAARTAEPGGYAVERALEGAARPTLAATLDRARARAGGSTAETVVAAVRTGRDRESLDS